MNDRDNGILLGKWLSQGDDAKKVFSDGVPPNLWVGSEAILSQYLWSKFKPVKYAQCWVFGGTLTTGNVTRYLKMSIIHAFNSILLT